MNSPTFKFDEFNIEVPLSRSYLIYLSDFSPQEQWNIRGFSGHDYDNDEFNNRQNRAIERLLDNSQNEVLSGELKSSISRIFRNLAKGEYDSLRESTVDRPVYFVIGLMRSGGTFLTRELMRGYGMQLQDFDIGMVHDKLPDYESCKLWRNDNEKRVRLLFELAQMIDWIDREFPPEKPAIKKRISFAYTLPILDKIFGEQARYVITVRDPRSESLSMKEFINFDAIDDWYHTEWIGTVTNMLDISESEFKSYDYHQQFLAEWIAYYARIGLDLDQIDGELIPLRFGEDYTGFLKEETPRDCDFEPFSPNERDVSGTVSKDEYLGGLNAVNELWEKNGIEFPISSDPD